MAQEALAAAEKECEILTASNRSAFDAVEADECGKRRTAA